MQLINSPTRDIVTCGECGLRQYLANCCRRCHQPLGVTYLEIPLPLSIADPTRKEPRQNLLGHGLSARMAGYSFGTAAAPVGSG